MPSRTSAEHWYRATTSLSSCSSRRGRSGTFFRADSSGSSDCSLYLHVQFSKIFQELPLDIELILPPPLSIFIFLTHLKSSVSRPLNILPPKLYITPRIQKYLEILILFYFAPFSYLKISKFNQNTANIV